MLKAIRKLVNGRANDQWQMYLMIEGGLILDDLHSNIFPGILSEASHDLPEGALAEHIPDYVPEAH